MPKLSRDGKVKCRKTTTRVRSIEGGAKVNKKYIQFFWVNKETADNPEMLKSLGLELA